LNTNKLKLLLLLVLGAILLGACSGNAANLVNTWAGLSADETQAYLASGSHVYAINTETGAEIWRYPAEADTNLIFNSNPALTPDGQLIIGSEGNSHILVSINPETGKDNWAAPFSGAKGKWVATPLVFNETIYAPNSDGFLYILDMNGKEVQDSIELGGALWSSPVTDGTYLYITSLDHHLHIIDLETLKLSDPIDIGGALPSSPAVGADGVYVGSFNSNIEYVSASGQNQVLTSSPEWIWSTPVFNNGTLYYADLGGNIYSLDVASNRQNWGDIKPDGPIIASPLVVNDFIYFVTEEGTLIALDTEGKTVWEKTVGGKIYTTPILSNDLILVAPYQADFSLAAYDLEGRQAWTFTPEK